MVGAEQTAVTIAQLTAQVFDRQQRLARLH